MKDTVISVVIVYLLFGGCVAWKRYEYRDCKSVGHTTFYCIIKLVASR